MIFRGKNKTSYVVERGSGSLGKAKNRERHGWQKIVKKILFLILLGCFLAVFFWTVFFSEVMQIQAVEVNSGLIEKKEVEEMVREELGGSYWGYVPKNNLFLIRKKQIRDKLYNKYQYAREVEIFSEFPDKIIVNIEERTSHVVWCAGEECYLVDERAESFFKLGEGDLKKIEKEHVTIIDQSGKKVEIGNRITKPELIVFYEKIPGVFHDETGIEISNIFEIGSYMSAEVKVTTRSGWYVLLSTDRSIETQATVLRKILDEKVTVEREGNLEYVDLRVKGKAIYRLKDNKKKEEEGVDSRETVDD